MLRNADGGGGGLIFSGKKRYEGVGGSPISRKKRYVTLEWPLIPHAKHNVFFS